jgi:hypothetical protein
MSCANATEDVEAQDVVDGRDERRAGARVGLPRDLAAALGEFA